MACSIKSWNARDSILAALGGTLAATAVVIIVSVILSPAGIHFSVTHASSSNTSEANQQYLNLTLAANNTSQGRSKVRYHSLFVDLNNSTNPQLATLVAAHVDTELPDQYLPAGNVTSFNASVLLVGTNMVPSFAGSLSGLTVVVTAQVRFKIGVACTRLYDVKVSCPSVLFPAHQQSSNSTAPPSVNCNAY